MQQDDSRKYNKDGEVDLSNSSMNIFSRRGHNIVHTMSSEQYVSKARLEYAEAGYCRNCTDNDGGYCKKYKKWASNARKNCKKKNKNVKLRGEGTVASTKFVFDPKDVGFENRNLGKTSIEYIKRLCKDKIIIWITGSGNNPEPNMATYKAVLEYNGKGKFLTGTKTGMSPNQIMIEGIIDCIKRINKPSTICIVCATPLGFQSAFQGKGINKELLLKSLNIVKEKKCKLVELDCNGSAEEIKKYIIGTSAIK